MHLRRSVDALTASRRAGVPWALGRTSSPDTCDRRTQTSCCMLRSDSETSCCSMPGAEACGTAGGLPKDARAKEASHHHPVESSGAVVSSSGTLAGGSARDIRRLETDFTASRGARSRVETLVLPSSSALTTWPLGKMLAPPSLREAANCRKASRSDGCSRAKPSPKRKSISDLACRARTAGRVSRERLVSGQGRPWAAGVAEGACAGPHLLEHLACSVTTKHGGVALRRCEARRGGAAAGGARGGAREGVDPVLLAALKRRVL